MYYLKKIFAYYRYKKLFLLFIFVLFLLPVFYSLFPFGILIFLNNTESTPRGIYYLSPGDISIGDYVVIDSNNILNQNVITLPKRLLKKVVGLPGDYLFFEDNRIFINGYTYLGTDHSLFFTKSLYLPDGHIFLAGDHQRSYDSRYFGLVLLSNLVKVRLLWAF